MKKQNKIKTISKMIGLTKLINWFVEIKYEEKIDKARFEIFSHLTSYERAFEVYKDFIAVVHKRTDIAKELRDGVMVKLREKRKNKIV